MKKVLFVCLGNICRSPMAEYVFRDMLNKKGLSNEFTVSSAGTSREEEGHGMHYGTRAKLTERGVPFGKHIAKKITREDYENYDYIIAMDSSNVRDMMYFFGGDKDKKISLLLSYAGEDRSVADPWYTGNFEKTYNDIVFGLNAFLNNFQKTLDK